MELPEDLITAEREAKAEFAAAHNAHQAANDRLDAARKAKTAAETALNDWFANAVGRKVTP